jgi:MoaA/NifB/PqqE/SkfB family radical SAM enzyme
MKMNNEQIKENIALGTIVDNLILISKLRVFRYFNKSIEPRFCTFTVTWNCDAKCYMCDIWKKESRNELSLEEIDTIFSDKLLRKLTVLRITGGEPFLRSDLTDIIKGIYDNTKIDFVHITSNGFLTDRIINLLKEVMDYGINVDIKISLDAIGKTHDKIRGVDGAFDKAYKTLLELKDLRKKYDFYVGINQIITDLNFDQITPVYELSEKLQFGFDSGLGIASRPIYNEKSPISASQQFVPYDNFEETHLHNILSQLKQLNRDNKYRPLSLSRSFIESLSERYYTEGTENRLLYNKNYPNPPCVALFSHIRIMPNGDVIPCSYKTEIIGNLKKTCFHDIWVSEKAKRSRQEIKRCSGCWAGCEVVPNAFHSGDILKWTLKDLVKNKVWKVFKLQLQDMKEEIV